MKKIPCLYIILCFTATSNGQHPPPKEEKAYHMPGVKDQGPHNHCGLYSFISATEAMIYKDTGTEVSLSLNELIDCRFNDKCPTGIQNYEIESYINLYNGLSSHDAYERAKAESLEPCARKYVPIEGKVKFNIKVDKTPKITGDQEWDMKNYFYNKKGGVVLTNLFWSEELDHYDGTHIYQNKKCPNTRGAEEKTRDHQLVIYELRQSTETPTICHGNRYGAPPGDLHLMYGKNLCGLADAAFTLKITMRTNEKIVRQDDGVENELITK